MKLPAFHRGTFPRLPFRPDVSPVKLPGEEFGLKGVLVTKCGNVIWKLKEKLPQAFMQIG